MPYHQVIVKISNRYYPSSYWNILPFQAIRETCPIESLMVGPDESSDRVRIVYRQKQLFSQAAVIPIFFQLFMTQAWDGLVQHPIGKSNMGNIMNERSNKRILLIFFA